MKKLLRTLVSLCVLAVLCLLSASTSSCSGVYAGLTGQPVPSTAVKRDGGSPINVATADLLQAEAGPPDSVYGLYNAGMVADKVGELTGAAAGKAFQARTEIAAVK